MKVCHDLPGYMGGGGYPEIVTNSDIGGREGSKNCHFYGDVLFKRSLNMVALNSGNL